MRRRRIIAGAALVLATLIGGTTGASPAPAATRVHQQACTVTALVPFVSDGWVGATALVSCSRLSIVKVQQNMREADGRVRSENLGYRTSDWLVVLAGTTSRVTMYTPCWDTERSVEEYYQGARVAVSGYLLGLFSAWAGSTTRSIRC